MRPQIRSKEQSKTTKVYAPELMAQWHSQISSINKAQWDACAGGNNHVASYDHLVALEDSGTISKDTGLEPCYLTLQVKGSDIQAAVPAFVKTNSKFELGIDLGWSLAHQRYAGDYYPKLQVELPFHPVSGPRFLLRQTQSTRELHNRLISELINRVYQQNFSSFHVSYCTKNEQQLLNQFGCLDGRGISAIWENKSYRNFDDYLSSMKSSRYRNSIRRERRRLNSEGIRCELICGSQITEEHMMQFFDFHKNTYMKYDQETGLNKEYFLELQRRLSDGLVFVAAYKNNLLIGAALCINSDGNLATLHWGCREQTRFLHFEVAYYQPIEFAISRGLKQIDAINTGEHKTLRGFIASPTYHSHYFRNGDFHNLISENLSRRRKVFSNQLHELRRQMPFAKSESL